MMIKFFLSKFLRDDYTYRVSLRFISDIEKVVSLMLDFFMRQEK